MNSEYSIQIIWSSEDDAYLAFPAELAGCMADGQTPEEALANLRIVIGEWLETANQDGRPIPKPLSIQDFARLQEREVSEQQKRVHQIIQQEVEKAVTHVVGKFLQQQAPSGWPSFQRKPFIQDPDELEPAGEQHHR